MVGLYCRDVEEILKRAACVDNTACKDITLVGKGGLREVRRGEKRREKVLVVVGLSGPGRTW